MARKEYSNLRRIVACKIFRCHLSVPLFINTIYVCVCIYVYMYGFYIYIYIYISDLILVIDMKKRHHPSNTNVEMQEDV